MQQIVHLDLDVQDKVSAVKELAKGCLGVEFTGNGDVNLLCDLLELLDAANVDDRVRGQGGDVGTGQSQTVLVVFEDQTNDIVDNRYRLVDLVIFVKFRVIVLEVDLDTALTVIRLDRSFKFSLKLFFCRDQGSSAR